jgi:hypothetical protein
MKSLKKVVLATLVLILCGCEGRSDRAFRLRTACGEQSKQFRAEWLRLKFHDPNFDKPLFKNHFNESTGHCYVQVYTDYSDITGDTITHFNSLYDSSQFADSAPIAMQVVLGRWATTWPDPKPDDGPEAKKIRALMEE